MKQDIIGQIRTVLLRGGSNQGVVMQSYGTTALVAMAGGTRTLATSLAVSKGDTVTVQGERIVAKRSQANRVYRV